MFSCHFWALLSLYGKCQRYWTSLLHSCCRDTQWGKIKEVSKICLLLCWQLFVYPYMYIGVSSFISVLHFRPAVGVQLLFWTWTFYSCWQVVAILNTVLVYVLTISLLLVTQSHINKFIMHHLDEGDVPIEDSKDSCWCAASAYNPCATGTLWQGRLWRRAGSAGEALQVCSVD